MFDPSPSYDYRPLGYLGKIPLTVTNCIILFYAAWVLFICLGMMFAGTIMLDFLSELALSSTGVLFEFKFWQIITYPLVFTSGPQDLFWSLFWMAITLLMLYWFGTEVEKFLGRQAYFTLVALTVVVPAIAIIILHFNQPIIGYADSSGWEWLIFVAFAIIYPNARLLFNLKAWWIAAFFIGISTLANLAGGRWIDLFHEYIGLFTTYYFLRYMGISPRFAFLFEGVRDLLPQRPSRRGVAPPPKMLGGKGKPHRPGLGRMLGGGSSSEPPEANMPGPPKRKSQVPEAEDSASNIHEDIDPILEKISQKGIESLTPAERKKLQTARSALLKTDEP